MGRTFRERKRKNTSVYSLHGEEYSIKLEKWIKRQGILKKVKCRIAHFEDTGRGIMTLQNINCGDTLLKVPFEIILSVYTISKDDRFIKLFSYTNFQKKVSCIELLSFYIAYLKIVKSECFWNLFIDSLPYDIPSLPYFYLKNDHSNIDNSIAEILIRQKKIIEESFCLFNNLLVNTTDCKDFTLELYEWSYFIVNSRCIFLESNLINKIDCNDNKLVKIISDDLNVGLIPFLDMFNHSSNIGTEFVLDDISKKNLGSQDYSNKFFYELKSKTAFSKYSQIFISYGSHCNLKLLTEYGFVLNKNPFSNVPFSFNVVCETLKSLNVNLTREQYQYILKHRLNESLFVASDGLSFNFNRLLYILTNNDFSKWNKSTFSASYNEEDLIKMNNISYSIMENRIHVLKQSLEKIENLYKTSQSTHYCIELLNEYLCLINHYIKVCL